MRRLLNLRKYALACFLGVLLGLYPAATLAADGDIKVEAQLVWGTNEAKSPDPKHKPVEPEVKRKLKELPLKWTNYFEVNRKTISIPVLSAKRESLSEKCSIEVRNRGGSKIEVGLFGKGEQVVKRTQELPPGETLVLGGNAPNATAWLVLVKRLKD